MVSIKCFQQGIKQNCKFFEELKDYSQVVTSTFLEKTHTQFLNSADSIYLNGEKIKRYLAPSNFYSELFYLIIQ